MNRQAYVDSMRQPCLHAYLKICSAVGINARGTSKSFSKSLTRFDACELRLAAANCVNSVVLFHWPAEFILPQHDPT